MMARPPLPLGTYGDIWVSDPPGPYKARARYRDLDGVTRTVARWGQTKQQAKDRLRAALAERQHDTGIGLRQTGTVKTLAEVWLEQVDASNLATNTKTAYRYTVHKSVIPRIGAHRIGELSTPVVDRMLTKIREERGPGAAATTRAVLNGMVRLAIRHGALTVNPVREAAAVPKAKRPTRSLTPHDVDTISDGFRADPRAVEWDLPDLIEFGLATGARIGEVLALRDSVVDLEAGTVEINATVIRVKGRGMVIQERPKTAAGWRVLALPGYAVDMLRRRRAELRFQPETVTILGTDGKFRTETPWVAFAAPYTRKLRDTTTVAGELRRALDALGYPWVTFHTFRKTVATRLDEAGLSGREVADQLGHSQPSMTQNAYMGRKVLSPRAAHALER